MHTQRINKIYYLHVSREKVLHCSLIFSIKENNISMEVVSIYIITYFAKNQRLWIKFSCDSQKIMDWFCSVGIQQKQSSRGVFRKRCFENLKQVYKRTPMPKCDFNKVWSKTSLKSHFGTWVFCCKFAAYFQNTFS